MMRTLALAVVLFAAVAFADDVDESDVLVLTKENFDSTIADNEFVLVEFYAPWCGHCKKLIPEYAKAATELKGKVPLAKVDATEETELGSKFEVRGYPTLKFFRSGSPTEYNGGRTAAEIVQWISKKSGPPSEQLADAAAVADWVKGRAALVGAFPAREGAAYDAFLGAAKNGDLDDFAFGDYTADKATITLYTAHAEPQTYDGENDADKIATWALENGYPLVDELPGAWARYQKKGLPLAILFTDPEADNSDVLKAVSAAAEQAKGLSFSFADGVRFAQQIERMGGDKDAKLPVIAAMKLSGKANYPYDGELTADALAKWANGIVDGSVKPHLKSEAIPEDNSGPVTVVVGKNFDSVVLDEKKDVLLEIYAPWCGHCKALVPAYDELGEHFKDNENIVIAKLDGTANDIDVEFRGFPTIKFFPAGKGMDGMTDYSGGRTFDDMKKFLEENAVNAKATGGDEKKDEL